MKLHDNFKHLGILHTFLCIEWSK
ncbi:hypothetical protein HYQ20_gp179 [Acinetobacter phage vB_AbaM_Berthold]|uniref:Uncharacterized protein n=1 Tax=Acinetobacter phage vB_AbaM_Berthold TaxID=2686290 RepID=A0A6B9JB66_9CAUD|nr:hypothetical protein HYQ20_gp179 [Acinetobacter phage vB_AbaM_Berthold]QGZ15556.1 hypothetical protein Berthold_215 [Acinetobacter phage vB_AbaM_Berthold]